MLRRLVRSVAFEGKGLHTGEDCRVEVHPSNDWYTFVKDGVKVRAHYSKVCDTTRNTSLCEGDVKVMSVEHILSALYALRIEGAEIVVSGPEIPALDGSAFEFAQAFYENSEGIEGESSKLRRPLEYKEGGIEIRGIPHDGLKVSYAIEYSRPFRYSAFASVDITPRTYLEEIARARTFAFEDEIEEILSEGLAKGGNPQNALIISREGTKDERLPDEAVKHKILDFLGDLALSGRFIDAHYIVFRAGHSSHVTFSRKLAEEGIWGKELNWKDILSLIPHRHPFLLVDRVIHLDEERVVGIKNVTFNDEFFKGHFPQEPIMPGVLQLEAMAQAAGVGIAYKLRNMGENNLIPLFVGIENARFKRIVRPGDTLVLEAKLIRFGKRLAKAKGRAFVDGQLVAEATMLATFIERE